LGAAAVLSSGAILHSTANADVSHKSGTPLTFPTQKQPPPPRFTPAPPTGTVAHTASQALTFAVPYFFGHGGTLAVHNVSEIGYIETKASTAMRLVRPDDDPSSYTSTSAAWLIVANGTFQPGSIGCQCIPPTYKEMAIVVVNGRPGVLSGYSNSFNLSGLRSLTSLPAAQWPQYE
jgi:hypothetical protein